MDVLIVGSGLMGVTSAYFLARRGYRVCVVDQGSEPGCAASFANGALLTPSMSDPWNSPGILRAVLVSSMRRKPIVNLRLRTLPPMKWTLRFLRAANTQEFNRNALHNLRLALHSLRVLRELTEETGIDYAHKKSGTLRIYRDVASFRVACDDANRLAAQGLGFRSLTASEALQIEPGLEAVANRVVGGIHYTTDEVGDARLFCLGLVRWLQNRGVEFRFDTAITALEIRQGRILAARSDRGELQADSYVLAAGVDSANLLRSSGLRLPIHPLKGYSLTIEGPDAASAFTVPVVDNTLHAAVVPIGNRLRVAGVAEFAGYDLKVSRQRVATLVGVLKQFAPDLAGRVDLREAQAWCGLRPLSADGMPIIGRSPVRNLFLNAGHGHLGWTMAAASGELLADVIANERPRLDPTPYALSRFSRIER